MGTNPQLPSLATLVSRRPPEYILSPPLGVMNRSTIYYLGNAVKKVEKHCSTVGCRKKQEILINTLGTPEKLPFDDKQMVTQKI